MSGIMSGLLKRTARFDWLKSAAGLELTDKEFLPPAAQIAQSAPSPIRMALIRAIAVLFFVALVLSIICKVEIYAVARGRIEPTGRSKIVQPATSGHVRSIYVRNGSRVTAGTLLVELDPTELGAARESVAAELAEYVAEIARRKAAIEAVRTQKFRRVPPTISFPPTTNETIRIREQSVLDADLANFQASIELIQAKIREDMAKRRSLVASLAAQKRILDSLQERLRMRQGLEHDGWESRSSVLDAQAEVDRQDEAYIETQSRITANESDLVTLQRQISEDTAHFISDNTEAIAVAEAKRDQRSQALVTATAQLHYTRIYAPITGTVQGLAVNTIGQVVSAGQQIMTLVPERPDLEVEALVGEDDIGFVRKGQHAALKVDAFPYTRYGTLSGRVVGISHDAVDMDEMRQVSASKPLLSQASEVGPVPRLEGLVFPIRVALDRSVIDADGHAVPLSPGMTVTVEVTTGKRSVLDYLLSPLRESITESGHER